jgi:hypothetical protein
VAQKIVEEDAESAGISVWTLRKAKGQLAKAGQVQSKLEGFGAAGTWYWRLAPAPTDDPDPLGER